MASLRAPAARAPRRHGVCCRSLFWRQSPCAVSSAHCHTVISKGPCQPRRDFCPHTGTATVPCLIYPAWCRHNKAKQAPRELASTEQRSLFCLTVTV